MAAWFISSDRFIGKLYTWDARVNLKIKKSHPIYIEMWKLLNNENYKFLGL